MKAARAATCFVALLWAGAALAQTPGAGFNTPVGSGGIAGGVNGSTTQYDLMVGGPTSPSGADSSTCSAQGYCGMPQNLSFTGNLSLSGGQGPTQSQLYSNVTVGGTSSDTSTYEGYLQFHFVDSAAANGNTPLNALSVRLQLTATQGLRNAIQSYISIDQQPSGSDASLQNYVSSSAQGYSQVAAKSGLVGGATFGGYAGSLWGGVDNVWLASGATDWLGLYGWEADTSIGAGASAAERYGGMLSGKSATVAVIDDAALDVNGTFTNGFEFGGVRHSVAISGALIATVNQTQGGTSTVAAASGVDFSGATLTSFLKGPGAYTVDGSGNTSGTTYKFNGTTTAASGNEIFEKAANTINFAVNGVEIANYSINAGSFFGNQNGATIFTNANTSSGASAQIKVNFQNSASSSEAAMILNGGSFSGGLGANAFAIVGQGGIWLQGGATPTTGLDITTSGVVQLPNVATGTPAASLCIDASNNIVKKTTTGSCI